MKGAETGMFQEKLWKNGNRKTEGWRRGES